jgi:hypothetical protein
MDAKIVVKASRRISSGKASLPVVGGVSLSIVPTASSSPSSGRPAAASRR